MKQKVPSRREAFWEALATRILVCDGAMGTMLYNRGIPFTVSFEELNISRPELVREIHEGYLAAGAQILETNTFGGNRARLQKHGLEQKVREINGAGARLAREVAGDKAWVFGSVGPLGMPLEPVGKIRLSEAREIFREQIEALLEGGVDFILLETFTDLREITQAMLAAKDLEAPVFAQMSFTEDLKTLMGDKPQEVLRELKKLGATVVGANCSVGPQGIFEVLEIMAATSEASDLFLSAMPNAGMPRMIGGRYIYLSSPEYMADYALRIAQLGVNIIGGCCGTTPAHIRMIAERLSGLKPFARTQTVSVRVEVEEPAMEESEVEAVPSPFAERIGREFLVSVEIDPPRGIDPTRFIEAAAFLKSRGIDAVNVADSPLARARMSPLVLAHLIQEATGIDIILHMSCRDRNLLGLQAELMGAHALGIRNILAITGDPPKLGDFPTATGVFDVDSIGLVELISRLNDGQDLMGRTLSRATSFFVGVAVNPVALDMERELERFFRKVEAGAQFAFTQPIYELKILENFLKAVETAKIPIFVGILPLRNAKHAEFLHNEIPEMYIPEPIRERMKKAGEEGPKEGVKIAQEFLAEARTMVQGAYIMPPFNRVEMAAEVVQVLK